MVFIKPTTDTTRRDTWHEMMKLERERNQEIARNNLISVMIEIRHVRPDGIVLTHSTGHIARYMTKKYSLKYFDADHVRPGLKQLAAEGLVEMIKTKPRNNHGGYHWRWVG